jgi:hypothetical protein
MKNYQAISIFTKLYNSNGHFTGRPTHIFIHRSDWMQNGWFTTICYIHNMKILHVFQSHYLAHNVYVCKSWFDMNFFMHYTVKQAWYKLMGLFSHMHAQQIMDRMWVLRK